MSFVNSPDTSVTSAVVPIVYDRSGGHLLLSSITVLASQMSTMVTWKVKSLVTTAESAYSTVTVAVIVSMPTV